MSNLNFLLESLRGTPVSEGVALTDKVIKSKAFAGRIAQAVGGKLASHELHGNSWIKFVVEFDDGARLEVDFGTGFELAGHVTAGYKSARIDPGEGFKKSGQEIAKRPTVRMTFFDDPEKADPSLSGWGKLAGMRQAIEFYADESDAVVERAKKYVKWAREAKSVQDQPPISLYK